MSARADDGLAPCGHAWREHARELGEPTTASFRARVKTHIETAPTAVAVLDPQGRLRYLLADQRKRSGRVDHPHREDRSTFFTPRSGVAEYVRGLRAANPTARWRAVDLDQLRAEPVRGAVRAPTCRIASVARGRDLGASARVP